MKTLTNRLASTALIVSGFLSLATASGAASANELTVTIDGIDTAAGNLMVGLYDEASYGGGEQIAGVRHTVSGNSETVVFSNLADGDYAIKLYHDANGNGELDRNLFGIPSEGYGFSNNGGSMGPPAFDEARFTISGDTEISITLR